MDKSPYYFCDMSKLDNEVSGGAPGGSNQACTPGNYAWVGDGCNSCTTPADGTNDAMMDIGNDCKAVFELNDIPCAPGEASLLGACDTAEGSALADGKEVAFGVNRDCYNREIGTTDITTGSVQRGSLPGISTALPEY